MNINKIFKSKYILIVICFIVILLGLFYLYNYFYNNIESFDINKCISTSLQNYYIGEPIINNIKNTLIPQGEVDVNIQMIENSIR